MKKQLLFILLSVFAISFLISGCDYVTETRKSPSVEKTSDSDSLKKDSVKVVKADSIQFKCHCTKFSCKMDSAVKTEKKPLIGKVTVRVPFKGQMSYHGIEHYHIKTSIYI